MQGLGGNPYLLLAATVAALAAILLIAGIRGRPTTPRRICRRCRYEVGEQAVCPECGRDLGGMRGARIVQRRARRGLVWSGVGVAGALVLAGATLGILAARGVDLNRYKPTTLLLWEAQSVDIRIAEAAAEELCRRHFGGGMSGAETDRALQLALDIHADDSRAWPGPLSALVNDAMLAGRMSAAQIRGYFNHIAQPQLVLPPGPPPRAGSPLTLSLDHHWRAGAINPARGGGPAVWVTVEPAAAAPAFDRPLILLPQRPDISHAALSLDIPEGVDHYEARAMVRYELNLAELGWDGDHPLARIAAESPGLGAFEREVTLAFHVAPEPDINVVLDTSDETRVALLKSIVPGLTRSGNNITVWFERRKIPVGLSARIIIRDPVTGQEWKAMPPLIAADEIGLHGIGLNVAGLTADAVDVRIVPAPELLRHSLLQRREDATATIFGEEVMIPGVSVKPREAPASPQATDGRAAGPRRRP